MTDESTFGRQPIQIVEIQQDLCVNTYGEALCTAELGVTGDNKCYNTNATCQDLENYALGDPLILRFIKPDQVPPDDGYYLPFLESVDTNPTKINIAGGSRDRSPLGNRAVINVQFNDTRHNDTLVDPYQSERAFDPFSRATFWAKWLKRNLYRNNRVVIVYDGYIGQSLTDMTKRTYLIDRIQGPTARGAVTLVAKDVLKLADEKEAQAPVPSTGILTADFSETDPNNFFTVTGEDIDGTYSVSGLIRINDEILAYTSITEDGTTSVTFNGISRGQFGTVAEDHEAEDRVQQVLQYDEENAWDIVYDLLTTYANVSASYIDKSQWDTEGEEWLAERVYSTLITEPTDVNDLIGELLEQGNFFIWWDEREATIPLRANRPATDTLPQWTDEGNILEGSLSLKEDFDSRITQIWIYWDRRNFAEDLDDERNFRRLEIRANLDNETEARYGGPIIRKLFSRWIDTPLQARQLGRDLLSRFDDPPRELRLKVDAKDRSVWTADVVAITTRLDVNELGLEVQNGWRVISAEEVSPGHVTEYVLQEEQFFGDFGFWMADAANDYENATEAELDQGLWWTDEDGLHSDGTEGYKWQ